MYFAIDLKIYRTNLDGSCFELVLSELGPLRSLALDLRERKIYYLRYNYEWTAILRADMSGRQSLLELGPSDEAQDIALDTRAGKMYWTAYPAPNEIATNIERANLDGSGREIVLSNFTPRYIALDLTDSQDVWISSSRIGSPTEPLRDCLRLTDYSISTDRCGDAGPLSSLALPWQPNVSLWVGQVPCKGQNLMFFGTSLRSQTARPPIAASAFSGTFRDTQGFAGFQVGACTTVSSVVNGPARPVDQTLLPELVLGAPGTARSLANKTYEVWSAESSVTPSFTPVRDCFRFAANTFSSDRCGQSGRYTEWPLINTPGVSVWSGQLVCQGNFTAYFGTSFEGTRNVMSAVAGGQPGTTLSLEGLEKSGCSVTR